MHRVTRLTAKLTRLEEGAEDDADSLDEPTSNKAIQRVRKAELLQLKAEIENLTAQIDELNARIEEKDKEIAKLKDELERMRRELAGEKKAASSLTDERNALQEKIKKLEREGAGVLSDLEKKKQELKQVQEAEGKANELAKGQQFKCPIDLIHSCRYDDLLLMSRIKQYCLEGLRPHPKFRGLRNYTLLVTEGNGKNHNSNNSSNSSSSSEPPILPPFQDVLHSSSSNNNNNQFRGNDGGDIFKDVANAVVREKRLDATTVAEALQKLIPPYRIVISGPDSFNVAARNILLEECEGVDSNQLTVLSA